MAAWRWHRWWWGILLVVSGVGQGVIPEGQGTAAGSSGGVPRATCPGECSCTVPGYVVCVADTGDVTPPTPPKDTHTLLLQGYTAVANQYLAHLPLLRHLQITRGDPQVLEQFPSLPQLEVLDMSLCGVLTLSTADLGHHIPNLNHLNMSFNRITTVGDGDLSSLGQLHVLDLRGNPLHDMHRDALRGLTHLQYLDLSSSQVGTLHHTWLRDTPTLAMLNVSRARIMEVPRLNHPRLATLDLSHNFITYLPQGLVAEAPGLRELYLHHNQLQHVVLASFTSAPLLHTLDLSYNQLVNIDEFVFSDLTNLRHLDLASNALLERVEHGAFTGLHNLEVLSLRNTTSLFEVEEVAFSGLPRLAMLDLRDSAITVLPLSLRLVTNHTAVLLAGTSLRCDCHHHWLPQLLTHTDISRWSGVEPVTCTDGHQQSPHQLADHLSKLGCRCPVIHGTPGTWLRARGGDSALLECNVTSHPPANILWVSATHKVFRYNTSRSNDAWLSRTLSGIEAVAVSDDPGVEVLASGHLLIKDMMRADMGRYKCFAYNSVGNASIVTFLGMDDTPLRTLYAESLLLGFALAALFLLVTLIVQFINYLMDRLGWSCCWSCCCCKDRLSPKARQIRKLLETVEAYKTQQLEKLRENYTAQVTTIKDSCYLQMERIRESYSGQTKNLKDLRDYSTQGLTSVKDQYLEQLNNIRDYSVVQMNRVSENYVFQRHRIRKFSAHQLLKLRETYKFQQKTLNKILGNLPDLYLQNCRTGSCQRTDSILFDDAALNGIDAYYKVDFFDTQSHASDYYTPVSTLGRSKSSKDKRHSRNSSNTSSDFVEAQPWVKKDSLSVGGISPLHSCAPAHSRSHNRSLSMATPASYAPDPVKVHKRSLSATHPYHRVAPAPETRGMPTRIMLCEETSDYELATPPTSPSSLPSTPTAGDLQRQPTGEFSPPSVHIETCQLSSERQGSQSPLEVSVSLDVDSPESTEDELLTALTDDLESNASTPFETSM